MMRRSSSWCGLTWFVVAVALALFAPEANAKPWAKWAPSPLASDADVAAFAAKPADSLTAGQLAWLGVQQAWREERDEEAAIGTSRDSDAGRLHVVRRTDERFASLAAQPYASLSAGDLAWLVSDLADRRLDRARSNDDGRAVGGVIVAVAIGAVVTVAILGAALGDLFTP